MGFFKNMFDKNEKQPKEYGQQNGTGYETNVSKQFPSMPREPENKAGDGTKEYIPKHRWPD